MTTIREILTRFDAFGDVKGDWVGGNSHANGGYTPGYYKKTGKLCSIGSYNMSTREFISNNLDVTLDYVFIMYPMAIVGIKNRGKYKVISFFLSRQTPFGIKSTAEHSPTDYIKKYLDEVVGELKYHATKGGVTFEEFCSEDFGVFRLLTKMEDD